MSWEVVAAVSNGPGKGNAPWGALLGKGVVGSY